MNNADSQHTDIEKSADILSEQEAYPTAHDKQDQTARVAAQDDMEA